MRDEERMVRLLRIDILLLEMVWRLQADGRLDVDEEVRQLRDQQDR